MDNFIPFFLILFVIILITRKNDFHLSLIRNKRRKENGKMDNSALLRYIGKECIIQANGYIAGLVGKVTEVSGNWISVEDKKGRLTTFNCDYISSIKEK